MSALTMSAELRARDHRDARRELMTHRCERCRARAGRSFLGHLWLCRGCRRVMIWIYEVFG